MEIEYLETEESICTSRNLLDYPKLSESKSRELKTNLDIFTKIPILINHSEDFSLPEMNQGIYEEGKIIYKMTAQRRNTVTYKKAYDT